MQVVNAVRVSQVGARLAVSPLEVLARDIQQATLVRRAIDQVLLDSNLVIALWRRIKILQLLARGSTRLSTRQRRHATAPVRSQDDILGLLMAELRVQLVVPARRVVQPHHPLIALLTRHQLGDHRTVLLVDVRFVDVRSSNGATFIILVVLG